MTTWRDDAKCQTLTLVEADRLFFPLVVLGDLAAYDAAIAYCGDCPVKKECAKAGAAAEFGVFGGTTPTDRGFDTDFDPEAVEPVDDTPEGHRRRNREARRASRGGAL